MIKVEDKLFINNEKNYIIVYINLDEENIIDIIYENNWSLNLLVELANNCNKSKIWTNKLYINFEMCYTSTYKVFKILFKSKDKSFDLKQI